MQLGVREAAAILNVSEKTIYRWIRDGKLPAYRVNEQYRLNRAELLEWATAQKVQVSPEIFAEPEGGGTPMPSLNEAIRTGGIYYRVAGTDRASMLGAVVELMRLPDEVDRKFLLEVLLARESLGSTGIGGGIAIPHVRNPIVLHIPQPMICLCFLEHAIDFAAIDGKPVHTVFTLVSPTVRAHLHMLSRLGYILREPRTAALLAAQASRDQILAAIEQAEAALPTEQSAGQRTG